jgi:hypothetical protein
MADVAAQRSAVLTGLFRVVDRISRRPNGVTARRVLSQLATLSANFLSGRPVQNSLPLVITLLCALKFGGAGVAVFSLASQIVSASSENMLRQVSHVLQWLHVPAASAAQYTSPAVDASDEDLLAHFDQLRKEQTRRAAQAEIQVWRVAHKLVARACAICICNASSLHPFHTAARHTRYQPFQLASPSPPTPTFT